MTRGIPFIKEERNCQLDLLGIHVDSMLCHAESPGQVKFFKAFREKAETLDIYRDQVK